MSSSVEVIHYKHFCRNALSNINAAEVGMTGTAEALDVTDLAGWLAALCQILSSMKMQHNVCHQLSEIDQQSIAHEVLLRQYGVQLRVVVNHFVLQSFKSNKKLGANFNDEITLIKQFGFADMYKSDILKQLNDEIESFISKRLRGEYEEPALPVVEDWVSTSLITFCESIFNENELGYFDNLKQYFLQQTYVALSRARAQELFDMVRDFPDSTPGVVELRHVSQSSGMMSFLGKTLKRALCGRLLHLGASTSDIIDVYVKMIRCFRILDPSNLLLNYVAKPIRKYLVGRKDTIRCIVSSLTEGDDDNLHSELRAGGSLEYGAGNDSDEEEDDEETPDIHWNPAKRALDFPGGREGGQTKDVLALLVSIYGSTDLFVTEYRSILAGRLLQNIEYFSDVEVKTLELLKIRFGEEPLHSCEVMLHDIDSSKRLNTAISAAMKSNREKSMKESSTDDVDADTIVNYCIVSDEYWPSLHVDSTLTHHTRAARLQTTFTDTFDNIKKPKKLEIAPQLGQVFLDLDFDDGTTREFSVSPTQATLILLISDAPGGRASLQQLADKSDLAEADVRKRMVYWVSRRVVREVVIVEKETEKENGAELSQGAGGVGGEVEQGVAAISLGYEIIEDQAAEVAKHEATGSLSSNTEFDMTGNEDMDLNGVSAEADESLALSSYEIFIKGMLQNQDGMLLERIHAMLKMVVAGGSGGVRYDLSIVQLRKFLQTLITADTLEMVDGLYKLRK